MAASFATLILAAGKGTRMKSTLPKVLHKVCGVPLVEHLVITAQRLRSKKTVVVVGYKHERVKKALSAYSVRCVLQKEQKGTAHAVSSAKSVLKGMSGDVLVIAGDVPLVTPETIRAFYRYHTRTKSQATVLTTNIADPKGYGRIVRDSDGSIARIVEELDASRDEKNITEVNSGIYFFKIKMLFEKLQEIKVNPKKKEFYLTDIIEACLASGARANAYCSKDPRVLLGVNSRKDLAALNAIMNEEHIRRLWDRGVTVLSPETTFIECGVRIGQDSVIYPCTYIERDVQIGKECEIGPFCKMRKGTRVQNNVAVGSYVEINRSQIKAHTNIKHLSYVGDATVGAHVNIGAGTITANYDGKHKHKTIIGEGVHTGSNTVLVAPVTLGKRAKTGAGTVVKAHSNVPAGKTAVGVPARILR